MPTPADAPMNAPMSAEELEGIGIGRYGGFGWISALARELGIGLRTAQRWAVEGVPKPATARAVRSLAASPVDPAFLPKMGGYRGGTKARNEKIATDQAAAEEEAPQGKLDL